MQLPTTIEQSGQRVLTTAQLAEAYGTDSRVISNNFNNNRDRYAEGKHFYLLTGDELRAFHKFYDLPSNVGKLYLWTEKGALFHAKSLNTDKAWEVYEFLVDSYFRAKEKSDSYLIADPIARAERWIEEQKEKNMLRTTVEIQNQQIAELQPKANYYDIVLNCPDLMTVTEIAKDYGQSASWLNIILEKKKIQYNDGNIWLLYAKYARMGLTHTKTHVYTSPYDGTTHIKPHTYWTQKGRLFIYELLKKDGILPTIEAIQEGESS
jgi:phage antirepressor YoqD-like protein